MKNRAPMEVSGDGLDMAEMMKMFASKNPPDNTIKRIEALEKLTGPWANLNPEELLRRVKSLETRSDKNEAAL